MQLEQEITNLKQLLQTKEYTISRMEAILEQKRISQGPDVLTPLAAQAFDNQKSSQQQQTK